MKISKFKSFVILPFIIIIGSCNSKSFSKEQDKYVDQIYIYEMNDYFSHIPMNIFGLSDNSYDDLELLMKADNYFDKGRFTKDSIKSIVFLDSCFELNRLAYTEKGISCGIGNNIANKLFLHKEIDAINELNMLVEKNFKSNDNFHVYQNWHRNVRLEAHSIFLRHLFHPLRSVREHSF